MLCGGEDKEYPATLVCLDRALELSSVSLCSLRRSFRRLLVSLRYWRLLKRVHVNLQSLYLKKASVASRNKKKLKFEHNSTFCRSLLKKSSLWKLRLAIIICACLVFTVPIFKSPRFFLNLFFMFLDIDECNSTNLTRCDQICENIVGSYKCSCEKGFNLVNGYRCEGIVSALLTWISI